MSDNITSTVPNTNNATVAPIFPSWEQIEEMIQKCPSHEHVLTEKDRIRLARNICVPDYGYILRGC